jgi:hypothetical protein
MASPTAGTMKKRWYWHGYTFRLLMRCACLAALVAAEIRHDASILGMAVCSLLLVMQDMDMEVRNG